MNVEQKVRTVIENRIARLTMDYEKYPILQEILKLDKYDCYTIFGIYNELPEDIDEIFSMVIDGLYGDSQLGAVSDVHGYHITHVSDSHVNYISEEGLFEIIRLGNKYTKYKLDNKNLLTSKHVTDIAARRTAHYICWRLGDVFKAEIAKYKET